jgi:hypothetical protein
MIQTIKNCHPILLASELYADLLNSTSMTNHMIKLLRNVDGITVVPYCYFHDDRMDYEIKEGKTYTDEITSDDYPVNNVDLSDVGDIVSYVVPIFRSKIPKRRRGNKVCGLIGVPIPNNDDPNANQDHYVSYIYYNETLMYFDSAIDGEYKSNETYNILIAAFNPKKIVVNKKTFETACGLSESQHNYVAQNIFCHTWSLWFLYHTLVKDKNMTSINRMAPKTRGDEYDRDTLIKIKQFVYNTLLDKLELTYIKTNLSLFDSFRYIIVNNSPSEYREIIKVR